MSLHPIKPILESKGNNDNHDPNAIKSIVVKTVSPLLIPQPLIAPITRNDTLMDKFRQAIARKDKNSQDKNSQNNAEN